MPVIQFSVVGLPAPQGSKTHVGKGRLVESSKRVKPWRADVRAAALDAYEGPLLTGAVEADLTFWFPRPKGHYGTGRNADALRQSAPDDHIIKPDLDKLLRAVLDALTDVVWRDDSQVTDVRVEKRYAPEGRHPGLRVEIRGL